MGMHIGSLYTLIATASYHRAFIKGGAHTHFQIIEYLKPRVHKVRVGRVGV